MKVAVVVAVEAAVAEEVVVVGFVVAAAAEVVVVEVVAEAGLAGVEELVVAPVESGLVVVAAGERGSLRRVVEAVAGARIVAAEGVAPVVVVVVAEPSPVRSGSC